VLFRFEEAELDTAAYELRVDGAPIRQRNSAGRSGYRFQPDGQDHIQSPFLEVAFHECTRSEKTSVSI
jgi:hypothetical protein